MPNSETLHMLSALLGRSVRKLDQRTMKQITNRLKRAGIGMDVTEYKYNGSTFVARNYVIRNGNPVWVEGWGHGDPDTNFVHIFEPSSDRDEAVAKYVTKVMQHRAIELTR